MSTKPYALVLGQRSALGGAIARALGDQEIPVREEPDLSSEATLDHLILVAPVVVMPGGARRGPVDPWTEDTHRTGKNISPTAQLGSPALRAAVARAARPGTRLMRTSWRLRGPHERDGMLAFDEELPSRNMLRAEMTILKRPVDPTLWSVRSIPADSELGPDFVGTVWSQPEDIQVCAEEFIRTLLGLYINRLGEIWVR